VERARAAIVRSTGHLGAQGGRKGFFIHRASGLLHVPRRSATGSAASRSDRPVRWTFRGGARRQARLRPTDVRSTGHAGRMERLDTPAGWQVWPRRPDVVSGNGGIVAKRRPDGDDLSR
jgi:hypothetical protein